MYVQYLSDDKGQVTAVQVQIEDWERLKLVHLDIDAKLPAWQTEILDQRLNAVKEDPRTAKPIAGLFEILNRAAGNQR